MSNLSTLYEIDFCSWASKNATLLEEKKFTELDVEHLIEEIKSMGASEKRTLESRLIELMQHLLKWQFQPERRGNSWEVSVNKQRIGIEKILHDNPSLKHNLAERVLKCYRYARRYAAVETPCSLKTFPESFPYSLEQLADFSFMGNV